MALQNRKNKSSKSVFNENFDFQTQENSTLFFNLIRSQPWTLIFTEKM